MNEINEQISNACFDDEMNYTQYKYFNNIFKKEASKYKICHNDINVNLQNIVKNKMESIIKEFLNFDDFSNLKFDLQKDLKLTEEEIKLNQSELLRKRIISLMNNSNSIENPQEFINSIEKYINKLLEIEKENNLLNNLNKEYKRIKNVINFDMGLRFCCFGCYSSGKSSLLNNLIGYNLNLLPVSSEECTKIGLIIKYTEKEDNISIYKINLIKQEYSNLNYFEYNKNERMVVGKDKVKETLNKLNESHEQFYYLLLTPIEILDELNIENDLKKRIEFIDFPGLNTSNLVNNEFNTILEMSNGFIYLNAGIELQKNENKKILFNIHNSINNRIITFDLRNCLFILTKCENKGIKDLEEKTSIEISEIFNDNLNSNFNEILGGGNKMIYGIKKPIVSVFSNKYYKEFKEEVYKIKDFKLFMTEIVKECKIKNIKITKLVNELEKKLESYIDFKEISSDEWEEDISGDEMNKYKNELIEVINNNYEQYVDLNESEKENIIIKYIKIKMNFKKYKKYKHSNFESLSSKLKQIINSSKKYFYNSIKQEAIKFISYCFNILITIKAKITEQII